MVLVALAMAIAGFATHTVLQARLDARINRQISQEVKEFRRLAQTGVDPRTGESLSSLSRLFEVALQRNVPDSDETLITLIGGQPYRRSAPEPPARLDTDPGIVRQLARGNAPRYGTLQLAQGDVRYASVPVSVQGDPRQGRYVVAVYRWVNEQSIVRAMTTFTWFALGALGVIAVVAWLVAGRLLAPVRLVHRTAQQISETDLTRRIPVSGTDDVSELACTFNAMLDRLEEAFQGQRQFLDDAGHELRTPITIVRGHLELLDGADAAELRETRSLVLDELDRMSRLVEDLVTLAKAQRPDFVRPGHVDLAQLTDDVLDKAAALAPREWRIDERAESLASADGQRLTQALVQLAQNAVAHTETGDVVALGTAVDSETIRLWVRDTGPGVPAEDAERIFARFTRGTETSRAEGSGLGLAIVNAIAEAHGGHVTLQSKSGFGATFTLEIPWRPSLPAAPATPEVVP